MDCSRIADVVGIPRMQRACVTVVGTGGSATKCCNLVRSGLGQIRLVDPDIVDGVNICRQQHFIDFIGQPKVEALAAELRRINPDVVIDAIQADFCAFSDLEIDERFGDTDVYVFGTDNHAAQARGNEVALRQKKPAVFVGLYPGGRAGEVVFWKLGLMSCYRCLCAVRYEAFANGFQNPTTEGATILDVQLLDSIAGMLTIGLLTEGGDNRHGRLIEQLGNRNFLQIKIDPLWQFGGRDVIRDALGIPAGNDAFFSFVTAARRDPDGGQPPCPDCAKFLGR